jgi:hypothetical protein
MDDQSSINKCLKDLHDRPITLEFTSPLEMRWMRNMSGVLGTSVGERARTTIWSY